MELLKLNEQMSSTVAIVLIFRVSKFLRIAVMKDFVRPVKYKHYIR